MLARSARILVEERGDYEASPGAFSMPGGAMMSHLSTPKLAVSVVPGLDRLEVEFVKLG